MTFACSIDSGKFKHVPAMTTRAFLSLHDSARLQQLRHRLQLCRQHTSVEICAVPRPPEVDHEQSG